MNLETAIATCQSDQRLLAAFYKDERVAQIVNRLVWEEDDRSELRQRLALLLTGTIIPRYDALHKEGKASIYAFISGFASNVTREITGAKQKYASTHTTDSAIELDANYSLSDLIDSSSLIDAPVLEEQVISDIDTENAFARFRRLCSDDALVRLSSLPVLTVEPVSRRASIGIVSVSDAPVFDSLDDEVNFIRQVMQELSFTIPKMAESLSIGHPRLVSYLSKRVKRIPKQVLDAAHILRCKNGGVANSLKSKVQESISDLAYSWMRRLGIDATPQNYIALSKKLNLSPSTVWRWLSGEIDPPVSTRIKYERIVVLLENRASKR